MQTPDLLLVKNIGEQGLLERLQSFCPQEIIGDDAAVIDTSPDKSLVVTTDMLVDGVHFSDRTTSPEDAGWRAAAANLSDLAAMGAEPIAITIGLGIRGDTAVNWVERLYQGIVECLDKYQTLIIGGDVVRSPVNTLSITAFGEVNPKQIIRRSTAKPGDAIVITGFHGNSRGGLELLLNPEIGKNLSESDRALLIQAHQRPQPRLDVLPLLREIINLESKITIAGMDSSDGLADAIVQICNLSGVGAKLDRHQIPISSALQQLFTPETQALDWVLYGGEDFELVLCLPMLESQILVEKLGKNAAIIGTITNSKEIFLTDINSKKPDQRLTLSRGFQHF